MKFLHHPLHALEDAERNFEQIEQAGMYAGTGAPTFQANAGDYYFRKDIPRIYVCTGGSAWIGLPPLNSLPPPSGSAATDATNIAAAVARGGIVVAQAAPVGAPYFLPNADVNIPSGCGLVGQGNANGLPGDSTVFKATGASSRLVVDGSGPMLGNFQVDGAGIANFPFQIGLVDSNFGGQRVFIDIDIANALLDGVTVLYHQNLNWIGGTIENAGRDGLHFDGGCGGLQFFGIEIITNARHGVYMSAFVQPNPAIGLYDQPSRICFYGGRSENANNCALKIDNAYGCTFDNFDMQALGNDPAAAVVGIHRALTGPPTLNPTVHTFRDVGFATDLAINPATSALFLDTATGAMLDGQCADYTGNGVNINTGAALREVVPTGIAGPVIQPFPT